MNITLRDNVSSKANVRGSQRTEEYETDEDLWAGKKTKERKIQDLAASTVLIEVIKECWDDYCNKKIARRTVFGKVADMLRNRGIRITKKKDKA